MPAPRSEARTPFDVDVSVAALHWASVRRDIPEGGRGSVRWRSARPRCSVRRRPGFSAAALPSACVRRHVPGGDGRGSVRWRSARTRRSVRRQRSSPAQRSTAPSLQCVPDAERPTRRPGGWEKRQRSMLQRSSSAQRPAAPSLQFPCASVLLRDVPGAALIPAPRRGAHAVDSVSSM